MLNSKEADRQREVPKGTKKFYIKKQNNNYI